MAKKYRFSADEYFCYNFREKSEEERKTFCADLTRIDICESLNRPENRVIFNDKMKTYTYFGKYYGRDFCGVKSAKDVESFKAFVVKHKKFLLKPSESSCGQGIRLLDLTDCGDVDTQIKSLLNQYCSQGGDGFVAEELIVQVPELAQFHPESVNTIRVATVRFDDGAEVIASFLRMGCGGSIVDNVGFGGVFGVLDISTGEIVAVSDKGGNKFTNHPDTGVAMLGFKIPRWEEAKALAQELATVVPSNRYTGWDLALTEKGWIMVEGNASGQFVWQIPTQKGFMNEVNQILHRLGRSQITQRGV